MGNNIKALFINKWEHDISGLYPKLRTYATFKLAFHIEPYLLLLKNVKEVSELVKFRLCSHYLQIELGRHNKTPINNRICGLEALKNSRLPTSYKKWVVDTAITKLTDIFELQWKVEINNMPKLRAYRELKSIFTCENYVKMLQPNSRSCIARLRSGVFPLPIETGCWRGKPIEERLCPVCPQPVVETEEHILLSCPLYNDIRAKHINQ